MSETFRQAFAQARRAADRGGPRTFTWRGQSYSTARADDPPARAGASARPSASSAPPRNPRRPASASAPTPTPTPAPTRGRATSAPPARSAKAARASAAAPRTSPTPARNPRRTPTPTPAAARTSGTSRFTNAVRSAGRNLRDGMAARGREIMAESQPTPGTGGVSRIRRVIGGAGIRGVQGTMDRDRRQTPAEGQTRPRARPATPPTPDRLPGLTQIRNALPTPGSIGRRQPAPPPAPPTSEVNWYARLPGETAREHADRLAANRPNPGRRN